MVALREMINKFLLLGESVFSTLPPDPNASNKAFFPIDLPSKTMKRWNQVDLGPFNPHLDKVPCKSKIVLVRKNVYNRNLVFFL